MRTSIEVEILNWQSFFVAQLMTINIIVLKKVLHYNFLFKQESKMSCDLCGRMVKNKHILKQHKKIVHEKKKGEFSCEECGKVLKSKGS